jgi:hypothetical protein
MIHTSIIGLPTQWKVSWLHCVSVSLQSFSSGALGEASLTRCACGDQLDAKLTDVCIHL